ncbi:MAG: hypothetical protein ABIS27_08105, partial [Longimicrobiales bacterium]
EQLGAAVAGSVCGAYVLWLTFRAPAAAKARTVKFWGFDGPLGAWVVIWGAMTMIVSVPFDNWWHGAYGLDVQILSPPHTVLMLGIFGIQIGILLFTLAAQNRTQPDGDAGTGHDPDNVPIQRRGKGSTAFVYASGVLIMMVALAPYEIIGYANAWHRSLFYNVTAGGFPILLLGIARTARARWPATSAAAIYMGIMLATMWILQRIPAVPKLAPIYNPVTHMVPLAFPFVLIPPALAIDLLERQSGRIRSDWLHALLAGVAFVGVMFMVHWFFAYFMLSPHARNFWFGADKWPYMYQVREWRHQFWFPIGAGATSMVWPIVRALLVATMLATVSARIGLAWGNFAKRVLR